MAAHADDGAQSATGTVVRGAGAATSYDGKLILPAGEEADLERLRDTVE